MQTNFTDEQLNEPALARSDEILRRCLQCGYCLDNCPTNNLLNNEFDSPKGRVYLIKNMLESDQAPGAKTVKHIDRCLSCLACMSSCPSFVNYMHLVDHARSYIEKNYRRPLLDRFIRSILASVVPYPQRFRLVVGAARVIKPLARLMPAKIRHILMCVPVGLAQPSSNDIPQIFPAIGRRKLRVGLMTGCVQKVLNTNINDATIRILRRHGCDVVIADKTGCCGALTYHMGKKQQTFELAEKNILAWMREIEGDGLDAIVINTSGCGTVIKDYGNMFQGHELEESAKKISSITKDISELLADMELDFRNDPGIRVAYHATCSLQFGQRIRFKPRKLLKQAGFKVLEPKDSHTCCGSAGTYHLLQPEISKELKKRKVNNLEQLEPQVIAAGNIGCMEHIRSGTGLPVVHTVELLDWVTGGPLPKNLENLL